MPYLAPQSKLEYVHSEIQKALVKLSTLFVDDMKLTFMARHPDKPERTILVTDETDVDTASVVFEMALRDELP